MIRRLVVVSALLVALPARVQAGNDDELIQGNDAAMSAGAITAIVRDGSGIWYNPAGLALATSDKLDVSANAFVVRVYRAPQLLSSGDVLANTDAVPEYVVAPAAVTFVRSLGPNLAAGVGIFVTKASDLSLRANLQVPGPLGDTAWLLALSRRVNLYHAGLGVGWAIDPRLRVGATLFAVYQSGSGTAELAGGLVSSEDASAFSTEVQLSNSSRIGLRFSAGAQWDVTDHLRLGVSVLSQGVVLASSFGSTIVNSNYASGSGGAFFAAIPEREEPFFGAFAPYRVRAGVAWVDGESVVSFDADYQTRLQRDQLAVDRLPVWNLRLGGRYPLSEDFTIGAGLFTDRDSNPAPVAFGDASIDLYGLTAGLTWKSTLKLKGDSGEIPMTFATTLAGRYAYGRGDFVSLEVFAFGAVDPPFQLVRTQLSVHEATFHLGSALQF
jgi:long-subunit fatty acid transport protein